MTLEEEIMKLDLIASDAFEGGNVNEFRQLAEWLRKLKKYEEGIEQIKEQINDYKGSNNMWDTANGMQFALECLEVNADENSDCMD